MKAIMKRMISILCITVLCIICSSCSKAQEGEDKKVKDLDFTVVEDADLPDRLMTLINERKMNPFKFKYTDNEFLYIVQGYGGQKSGGYSISVDEMYLAENAVYIKTNLIGPGKNEPVTQAITYPYVVVKIEFIDKPVVFQ